MSYDFKNIHGSTVVKNGLNVFNALNSGDILLFPCHYRIIFTGQNQQDFYRQLVEIQSYLCGQDFSNAR